MEEMWIKMSLKKKHIAAYHFMKQIIQHSLECGRIIGETNRYGKKLIASIGDVKFHFVGVVWSNKDLLIQSAELILENTIAL